MKKILLLTKNNPIEIYSIMMYLFRTNIYTDHKDSTLFFSPQYTAYLAVKTSEARKNGKYLKYQEVYFPAIDTWEKYKQSIIDEHHLKFLVVVGQVPASTRDWYDAILSVEPADDGVTDYTLDIDQSFNHDFSADLKTKLSETPKYTMMSTKDGEIKFANIREAYSFLAHVQKMAEEEDKNGKASV